MAVARNVGQSPLQVVIEVQEGNVTENTTGYRFSGTVDNFTWASQVEKDDLMIIGTTDYTVIARTTSDSDLVGVVASNLDWMGDGEAPSVWVGSNNTATTDYRSATIEIFGQYIRVLTLRSGSGAVALGTSVEPTTSGDIDQWEDDATLNHTFALTAGTAGNTLVVIFGWHGEF